MQDLQVFKQGSCTESKILTSEDLYVLFLQVTCSLATDFSLVTFALLLYLFRHLAPSNLSTSHPQVVPAGWQTLQNQLRSGSILL